MHHLLKLHWELNAITESHKIEIVMMTGYVVVGREHPDLPPISQNCRQIYKKTGIGEVSM